MNDAQTGLGAVFDDPFPIEAYLLDAFALDRPRLYRVAMFLLAHAALDRQMILALGQRAVENQGGINHLGLDGILACFRKAAGATFGDHLQAAKGLMSPQSVAIAEEVNRARNAFLHWRPGQEALRYKGADVTTDDGLKLCSDDVLEVLKQVL